MAEGNTRGRERLAIGVVTRDRMNKTRRVEIQHLVKHKRYGKYIKRRTICYVHDEQNESRNGDRVEIIETRPLSKTKRWRLTRIVTKAPIFTSGKSETTSDPLPESVTAPAEASSEETEATKTNESTE